MARPKDTTPRVRGPYWNKAKGQWVAQVLVEKGDGSGRRSTDKWLGEDRVKAQEWVDDARAKLVRLHGTSVKIALPLYRTWLIETGHKKPATEASADEAIRRLTLYFAGALETKVANITEEKAEELYRNFAARTYQVGPADNPRTKPVSVDYHRGVLSAARSFFKWAIKPAKLITSNPLAEVRGMGTPSVGKELLTGDEATKFYEWCAYKAYRGDLAALALLMLLMMALRQGDVRKRVVRDVDLGGTRLRIGVGSSARSKTKKGDRPRIIPVELQPLIRKVIEGRSPLEPLFKDSAGGFHTKSWLRAAARRFCAQAGVPYVCPHGLKGTAGTLASESGALAQQVAEYLSHESKRTSERSYVADGAMVEAEAAAGLKIITGGKR